MAQESSIASFSVGKERKTASGSQYLNLNNKNMNKDCPGSQYDRTKTISIMILEKSNEFKDDFFMRDIVYLDLDDAYKKYIDDECKTYPSPFNHLELVYKDVLKNRIISQYKYRSINYDEYSKDNKDYFVKYCFNNISDEEKVYLDNTMHFDDHLIDWSLSSDFSLREKAMEIIKASPIGSWLVRRSSVKEQEHVKIRVITCRLKSEKESTGGNFSKGKEEIRNIGNYLLAHINGFGYILTNSLPGSSIPSLGENIPIKIVMAFYSLPDLLDYMKRFIGIELSMILKGY